MPARAAIDRYHRQVRVGLLCASFLLWAAGLFEFYQFIRLVAFYFPVGITSDAGLYFAVARGLLNGLHMYADLFETKPPMVFWISELSLVFTHGDVLYRAIQALALAAIPVMLAVVAYRATHCDDQWLRALLTAGAFLFGSGLVAFAASRSLGFQTEGFGVVPATLAILLFALHSRGHRLPKWQLLAIAICMCIAVLFKEPFGLSVLAGLLVHISSRSQLLDAIRAIGIAIILWLAILMLTRTLHSYITLYLPEIISGRIAENALYHDFSNNTMFSINAPLWIRGLNILRVISDMAWPEYRSFPSFPLLALAIASTFVSAGAFNRNGDSRLRWFLLSAVVIAAFVLLTNLAFALEQLIAYLHFQVPWRNPFFQQMFCLLLAYAVAFLVPLCILVRCVPATSSRLALTAIALYLAGLAVAAGGDYAPHHYLFAVPVYVAGFVALVQAAGSASVRWWCIAALTLVLVCLVLTPVIVGPTFTEGEFLANRDDAQQQTMTNAIEARRLDALLTACSFRRYFATDDLALVPGMTAHSPYQLAYGLERAESQRARYFDSETGNPYFHTKLIRDFNSTPIIVRGATNPFPYPDLAVRFSSEFSATAPPCAQPYLPIPGLYLYFRK